jgi:hypothetical protein
LMEFKSAPCKLLAVMMASTYQVEWSWLEFTCTCVYVCVCVCVCGVHVRVWLRVWYPGCICVDVSSRLHVSTSFTFGIVVLSLIRCALSSLTLFSTARTLDSRPCSSWSKLCLDRSERNMTGSLHCKSRDA